MKMSKKTMMKSAHKITKLVIKKVANLYNEKQDYSTAFKFALKEVWYQVKKYNKARFGQEAIGTASEKVMTSHAQRKAEYRAMYKASNEICGIKRWIVEENLSNEEITSIENYLNRKEVIKETAKAVDIKFVTDLGNAYSWFPKSQLTGRF